MDQARGLEDMEAYGDQRKENDLDSYDEHNQLYLNYVLNLAKEAKDFSSGMRNLIFSIFFALLAVASYFSYLYPPVVSSGSSFSRESLTYFDIFNAVSLFCAFIGFCLTVCCSFFGVSNFRSTLLPNNYSCSNIRRAYDVEKELRGEILPILSLRQMLVWFMFAVSAAAFTQAALLGADAQRPNGNEVAMPHIMWVVAMTILIVCSAVDVIRSISRLNSRKLSWIEDKEEEYVLQR